HEDPVPPVEPAQLLRMEIHPVPVSSERTHPRVHLICKAAQCNIHKPHGKIQLIPADPQDLATDPVQLKRGFFPLRLAAFCYFIIHISPFSQEIVCVSRSSGSLRCFFSLSCRRLTRHDPPPRPVTFPSTAPGGTFPSEHGYFRCPSDTPLSSRRVPEYTTRTFSPHIQ